MDNYTHVGLGGAVALNAATCAIILGWFDAVAVKITVMSILANGWLSGAWHSSSVLLVKLVRLFAPAVLNQWAVKFKIF